MRRPWLFALLLSCGCVPSDAYVGVDFVPPHYAYYPHTYYDGHVTYYIDGRWYAQRDGGWGYLRDEPPELYRYRRHVEQAPRAYPHGHHEHHEHHHERESAPPAYSAPPAERVR